MSDFDIIKRAMRNLREQGRQVASFVLATPTESRLMTADEAYRGYLRLGPQSTTLFDLPVEIDDSLPAGEVRLKDGNGKTLLPIIWISSRPLPSIRPTDDAALLRFIREEGEHAIYGKGISTYPDRDASNQLIYEACVHLEQRGLVYRKIDEPGHVLFMPKE